jgi:hypothetical protein
LRKRDWVEEETGLIDAEAFFPDKGKPRPNGDTEASINWEDDASVEAMTLADANGRYGAARLPLSEIARTMRREITAGAITAERTRLANNPYHGDIVFRSACSPKQRKMIASSFALESKWVRPRSKSG